MEVSGLHLTRPRLCEMWRRWMRSCIHIASVLVLVNGSPAVEFQIEKWLRQGDPLAPFLFLVAAEQIASLMRRDSTMGLYKPFKVNENVSYSMLQFADEMTVVGESSKENLWSIMFVLRVFELALRLRVNYSKVIFLASISLIISCRLPPHFLSCCIDFFFDQQC